VRVYAPFVDPPAEVRSFDSVTLLWAIVRRTVASCSIQLAARFPTRAGARGAQGFTLDP